MTADNDPYSRFLELVRDAAATAGIAAEGAAELSRIAAEPPDDPSRGDVVTNAALVLAKQAGETPHALGERLARVLAAHPDVEAGEVAGPGFINCRLAAHVWQSHLKDLIGLGEAYGRSDRGTGRRVSLEAALAGAAGPMSVERYRPAVVGDALANLMEFAGYRVTRELSAADRDARGDLARLGIRPDAWSFESGKGEGPDDRIAATIERLASHGLTCRDDRQRVCFRPPNCGDDVDNVLVAPDGDPTGLAVDIARHHDRILRGFELLIDVVETGRTEHASALRMCVEAMTGGHAELEIRPCLPAESGGGRPARGEKRAGDAATLAGAVEEIGADAVRFAMLSRGYDAPLDFDIRAAADQSRANPGFFVPYVHARCRAIFRRAADELELPDLAADRLAEADLSLLADAGELALVKRLAVYPRLVAFAAEVREPHRLATYLHALAGEFHDHWNRGKESPSLRFIHPDGTELSMARLALVHAVRLVIASGLAILGVTAPDEMR